MQKFLPHSEPKFQAHLYPAQVNLQYLLAWFQSLQVPSAGSESLLALMPLSLKSQVSIKSLKW
jgi:hypothetical protein